MGFPGRRPLYGGSQSGSNTVHAQMAMQMGACGNDQPGRWWYARGSGFARSRRYAGGARRRLV